jgi:hypothetical protein
MSQDLTQQWLTEIQEVRQQLVKIQQERDAAWESSEKWRKLYNTEGEQRRTDAKFFQQAIASLKVELQKLKGINESTLPDTTATTAIKQEVAQLKSVEELQAKLITVIKERDHLLQALKTEQEEHAQTGKNLTTALGDAIDSLTRERDAEGARD